MGIRIFGTQITGRPPGFASPGPYQHGLWLVAFPNGSAGIYDKQQLPKPSKGIQYWWLGTTAKQANDRFGKAEGSDGLNLSASQEPGIQIFQKALNGHPQGIAGDWSGGPAGPGPRPFQKVKPAPTAPGASYQSTNPSPFGLDLSAVTDFLNYAAWLLHPLNWLRLVEFMSGLLLAATGMVLLTRRRGGPTGVARAIVTNSPAGRTVRTIQGRRMGRREGQREAARMEARQAETYDARTRSAYERESINVSARRAARGDS